MISTRMIAPRRRLRPPRPRSDRRPAGFTLVEMLIVLVVLAAMAALSMPAVSRLSRRGRLQDAAGRVRAELGAARLAAIESGVPREFRFQPGGSRFEVVPRGVRIGGDRELFGQFGAADGDDSSQSEPLSNVSPLSDVPPTLDDASADEQVTVVDLDEDIRFWTDQMGGPPLDAADAGGLTQLSPSEDGTVPLLTGDPGGGEQWSAPIVFYPNGRTLNAHLVLTDGRDAYVEVTLRGLTGAASVGPVFVRPHEPEPWEEMP